MILDGQETFAVTGENADIVLQLRPHFLLQTDGGCRRQGTSAISYVIYCVIYGYGDEYHYYTLAFGGERIICNFSSLELEARAFSLALQKLVEYLSSYGWE